MIIGLLVLLVLLVLIVVFSWLTSRAARMYTQGHYTQLDWISQALLRCVCRRREFYNDVELVLSLTELTRRQQMIVGAAIGDAFGAGVEMQSRQRILDHVDFRNFVNWRGEGSAGEYAINYADGFYTDDTEMLIANARALSDHSTDLVRYYVQEYEKSKTWFGVGRQGHGSIRAYFAAYDEGQLHAVRARQAAKKSPGNAPPMRAAIFGLCDDLEQLKIYARLNADCTHPHPVSRAASFCIAYAAHMLVSESCDQQAIISRCIEALPAEDTPPNFIDYLRKVDSLAHHPVQYRVLLGPKWEWGLSCDSMYTTGASLFVVKHHTSSLQTLKEAILLGGDVDSVASIALSLVGAMGRLSLKEFPRVVIQKLERFEYLLQV